MVIFHRNNINTKSELERALYEIMMGETRLWLLRTLISLELATLDVYNFAVNQAGLRSTIKTLDWPTMKSALRAKLRDTVATLTIHRRRISVLEEKLKSEAGENFKSLKKIIRPLLKPINMEREKRMKKFKNKIEHYCLKQPHWSIGKDVPVDKFRPTSVPWRLRDFADISIFKRPECLPKSRPLKGPFVGNEDIKLNEGERALLSRDPKFSLRYSVTEHGFKIELEKMISKQRINDYGKRGKKQLISQPTLDVVNDTACDDQQAHINTPDSFQTIGHEDGEEVKLNGEKNRLINRNLSRLSALDEEWNSVRDGLIL